MRLINMICPNCGANLQVDADRKKLFCMYCGSSILVDDEVKHFKFDNAEETGYQFEKGRQRARNEAYNLNYQQQRTKKTTRKKRTWLWVLGWIFIFPVPLTILIWKNKKMDNKSKLPVILASWFLYFLLASIGGNSDNDVSHDEINNNSTINEITSSSNNTTETISELTIEEETSKFTLLYEHNDMINIWLNKYNNLYPHEQLTKDDFSVYYHHGSYHENQIKLILNDFSIVVSASIESADCYINCYEGNKTTEECKNIFVKILPIYCPNLTNDGILKIGDTIENDSISVNQKLENNVQVDIKKSYDNSIESITISGGQLK